MIYNYEELVRRIPSETTFNTGILRPGSEFFMESNGKCGIIKVLDCGKRLLTIMDCNFLNGIHKLALDEGDIYDIFPNPIMLKTLDELTSFDLFKRGFNGYYKLRASTIAKIKDILDEEDDKSDGE